jgi:hypothetical protein
MLVAKAIDSQPRGHRRDNCVFGILKHSRSLVIGGRWGLTADLRFIAAHDFITPMLGSIEARYSYIKFLSFLSPPFFMMVFLDFSLV